MSVDSGSGAGRVGVRGPPAVPVIAFPWQRDRSTSAPGSVSATEPRRRRFDVRAGRRWRNSGVLVVHVRLLAWLTGPGVLGGGGWVWGGGFAHRARQHKRRLLPGTEHRSGSGEADKRPVKPLIFPMLAANISSSRFTVRRTWIQLESAPEGKHTYSHSIYS